MDKEDGRSGSDEPSGSQASPGAAEASPPSVSIPNAALSAELMLGPFLKEYADLGHWFDSAHGKCIRCEVPTIDLYEDGWYGPVRCCASGTEARSGETACGLDPKDNGPVPKADAQPSPPKSIS